MRVAQVMAGAVQGGAETFYERLCLGLHDSGEEVLPVIRREPAREARLREGGLTPVTLGFGGPLDLLTGARLRAALGRFRPAVTVAWMNRAARFTPKGEWTLVGRLGGYYDLRHYRRCDHLVANTRDLVAWITAQGWAPGRVHHLPNFVPDMAGAASATLPAPPGKRRLLAMGRLHRNKGFDVLLRALAELPEAHLSLAGEGPERPALEGLARELGLGERVSFLGWRTDTGALLAGAEVFVCPSRHEPLGNVVLEAFSASRPVVAAAAQGPSEVIRDGGTGLLVPLEEPAPLAAAIRRVLDDPALSGRLAEAGRRDFEAEHAAAPVLARWRGFLRAVAPTAAGGEVG
ncbi:Lipopolysaccharide core biosynthesis glycosyl transferase lpsD [Roseomonas mucosa]|uniref:Glycosyl transferase n=2 Tax=Roseomonas mucosa TaxID=207340 RepID=A0A1S8D738_9PROT|nr:glycosyl transferase [Roseomonas mucosa]QDE00989.1 Lipopolysaccharide core biosynthesis glycosyl transferase lpsD [Roseomonas mucosa]QDJ10682.1 Lipopolysaccharide core biosynthesis glycosyl transferase lpsD [Roseomonas mucosa]QET93736.1 glycosyltransferase [Roseomonas mucosa]UZO93278.1 Lipopolysaccharide core biosynthesis glycosyl transferase lpsD [Roseomonas mucosa]